MQKFSELYRYYRLKGILRKTLLKFLFFFRIRLRITYYYVKKLDGDSLHNISVRYRDLSFDDFVRQQDFCNRASQVGFVRAGYKRRIAVCSCSINNGPAKTFVRKYYKSQS